MAKKTKTYKKVAKKVLKKAAKKVAAKRLSAKKPATNEKAPSFNFENLFGGIYKGKKVFLTGHSGFKGSWLSLWLTKMGAKVVGYSKDYPSEPSHFKLLNLPVETITADVLDKAALAQAMKDAQPDIVFHMAAQPIVRTSYREPVLTLETNIMGTVNVLESARYVPSVKAVVIITSDKCYQNVEKIWGYREHDAMGGDDPYSASKGAAELVARAYMQSFYHPEKYKKDHNTLVATVRAGNVIGGGDWAKDRLIPDIMRATAKDETVPIRSPHATRPWQHVLEPLSGYLHVGSKLLREQAQFSDNYNFGPNSHAGIPVGTVLEHAKKHWPEIRFAYETMEQPMHEATLLTLDSTKAHTKLKWYSVWTPAQTFEKTTLWYKEYYKNGRLLSEQDLSDYVENARQNGLEWAHEGNQD